MNKALENHAARGLLFAALTVAGCALRPIAPPREAPPAYLSASLDELLARLAPGDAGVATLQGSYSAVLADRSAGTARSFSGMLAMEKPDKLRMKGSAAMLPNLFDLLCDGDRAALYVPRENAVYRASGGVELLRHGLPDPQLLTSLFVGEGESAGTVHFVESFPSRYIVYTVIPGKRTGKLVRKVVFDRTDLSPVLFEYFDSGGVLQRTVRCADFLMPQGCPAALPREILIEEPAAGRSLALWLDKFNTNVPLNPGMFSLVTPPGARTLSIEEHGE